MLQDLRHAVRVLRASPGFTAAAVLCIALGIGANTAIFSVVEAVLLEPLPFSEPERLVRLWEHNTVRNNPRNVISPSNYMRWEERAESFEKMAAMFPWDLTLRVGDEPERVSGGVVTAEFFTLLGAPALRGRNVGAEDLAEGAPDVAAISAAYWKTRFGSDPDIVGRTIQMNGSPVTIVGVTDPGLHLVDDVEVWFPFRFGERHRESRGRWITAVARLAPGVTIEQAQAEMATIATQLAEERPDFNTGWTVDVVSMHRDLVQDVRGPLLLLLGAVGFVLLIACANVANLMLAHGARRQRELAVRAAIGADRWRIVRLVLTESLLLSLLSGAISLLVAAWTIDVLGRMGAELLPRVDRIGLNHQVLGFAFGLSLFTGLLFGLLPALSAARHSFVEGLRGAGRGSIGSAPQGGLGRSGLIVAQVALSLVLLVGAGLLINSFRRVIAVDPGFDPQDVLTLSIDLPGNRYDTDEKQAAFFHEALERIEALSGVDSATAMSFLPIGSTGAATTFAVLDRPAPPQGEEPVADVRAVTPGFFRAMRIRLLQGREFTHQDRADAPPTVVINRSAAEDLWPGEDPVGQRIGMSWGEQMDAEVIGVVEDVRLRALDTPARYTLYWSNRKMSYDAMTLLVRFQPGMRPDAAAVRAQIQALDADLPVASVRTMDEVIGQSLDRPRFLVLLLSLFSGVALVLALVGLYGVMAYLTARRTREFGVRMALGARPRDLLGVALRSGLRLAVLGSVVGILSALALTRLMTNLLYEVSPSDPATFVLAWSALIVALLAACYVPARRATRVNPVTALRCE